jgi:fluoride exporter
MNESVKLLVVFVGAGTGGVLRFLLDRAISGRLHHEFPWGTLTVNVSGCAVIGVLYAAFAAEPGARAEWVRLALMVGVLGGYTTFSAFSRETLMLLDAGLRWQAAGYVVGSVLGGLAATVVAARMTAWMLEARVGV